MLTVNNLTKRFGRITALESVSLECREGEIVGFLGPNGAGKTTTMRLITGFFEADEGEVRIKGIDIRRNPKAAKRELGYLPEDAPVYPQMTLDGYLRFLGGIRGTAGLPGRINYVLEACELKDRRSSLLGEFSRGMRQRAELAGALLHDPSVLILDEPTSGMDPFQRQQFRELIQYLREGKTVLYSTHILSEVSDICDRLVIINEGKIVAAGTPSELAGQAGDRDLRINFSAQGKDIKKQVASLDRVIGVETLPGREPDFSRLQLLLKPEDSRQVTAALGKLVRDQAWLVGELSVQPFDLEETFVRLTR
ncbi:MAG: ABC transporter ATP-binding protein, partial [bacterium]